MPPSTKRGGRAHAPTLSPALAASDRASRLVSLPAAWERPGRPLRVGKQAMHGGAAICPLLSLERSGDGVRNKLTAAVLLHGASLLWNSTPIVQLFPSGGPHASSSPPGTAGPSTKKRTLSASV
ncbi:hypothetical protein DFH27DRAFT_655383 [Peziza echinospora]|nr:hypothetical protein DFH27DRAFT_655383 [Peziza echinospora]